MTPLMTSSSLVAPQSLAAGLTSSQPVEKLRALPLWLSLQYLGHDGIVERIRHASQLVSSSLEAVSATTRHLTVRVGEKKKSFSVSIEPAAPGPFEEAGFHQDNGKRLL